MNSIANKSLESAIDKMGVKIERGSYVVYGYKNGPHSGLVIARVQDIYEEYLPYGHKAQTRLKVKGVRDYYYGHGKELAGVIDRLKFTSDVMWLPESMLSKEYKDALAGVEVGNYVSN